MIDESKMIQTIVVGSDWQEVLSTLIAEEGMDPLQIDIIKLTDAFVHYLQRIQIFDFRVPARFVLIAAILLRMKAELLLIEEEEKARIKQETLPKINLENIPELSAPMTRKTTRKVTLMELVNALQKAFELRERKEEKVIRLRAKVTGLIDEPEDIEAKINRIFDLIIRKGNVMFSDLVVVWRRKEIVDAFLPMLYLCQRSKISCEQDEMFKDIRIRVR